MLGSWLWRQLLKITPGYGGFTVVVRVTPHHGELESSSQGEGNQVLHLQGGKEEHLVPQKPKILLAILGKMALKPEVKFDNLYSKLYNVELWLTNNSLLNRAI